MPLIQQLRNDGFLRLLAIASVLFVIFRLVYWFGAFPNPDEAYYWLWGSHPELSYFDHPPLQAWLQGLSGTLFGDNRFALRLFNLFTTVGLFLLYYRYLQTLVGERAKPALLITFALAFASPVMFGFLATAWPDHIMLYTSSLAVFFFLRFFDSYLTDSRGDSVQLYLAALALGLSAMAKYNSVFIAIGVMLTLSFDARLRRLWRDPRLYLAALITLLVMMPLLLWNLENHLASFSYQLMQRTAMGTGSRHPASLADAFGFILVIVFTLSPFIIWLLFRLVKQRKQLLESLQGRGHYLSLPLWIFAASSGTFIVLSLSSPMLYYWNIVAYPYLFPLLAVFLLNLGRRRWAVVSHLAYGLIFAGVMIFHTTVNPISAYVDETGDQDSRMLYGWSELTPRIEAHLAELKGEDVVLMATGYRKASALAYTTGRKDVVCISSRRDEFDYWQEGKRYGDRTALILYDDWHPINAELRRIYSSIKTVETVEIRHLGKFIKRYYIAIGRNPTRP